MTAIVDYGVGNLFSLRSSFGAVGEEAAVGAVSQDVAMIGDAGDVMGGSIADMMTGSLGLNPNLKVINAAEYVM